MQSDVANIIGVSEESIWNCEDYWIKPSKKDLEIINEFVKDYLEAFKVNFRPVFRYYDNSTLFVNCTSF